MWLLASFFANLAMVTVVEPKFKGSGGIRVRAVRNLGQPYKSNGRYCIKLQDPRQGHPPLRSTRVFRYTYLTYIYTNNI